MSNTNSHNKALPQNVAPDVIKTDAGKRVIAYMCLVEFEYELGSGGSNIIYATPKECFDERGCIERCGMAEVEVRFLREVPPSEYQEKNYSCAQDLTPSEIEDLRADKQQACREIDALLDKEEAETQNQKKTV